MELEYTTVSLEDENTWPKDATHLYQVTTADKKEFLSVRIIKLGRSVHWLAQVNLKDPYQTMIPLEDGDSWASMGEPEDEPEVTLLARERTLSEDEPEVTLLARERTLSEVKKSGTALF